MDPARLFLLVSVLAISLQQLASASTNPWTMNSTSNGTTLPVLNTTKTSSLLLRGLAHQPCSNHCSESNKGTVNCLLCDPGTSNSTVTRESTTLIQTSDATDRRYDILVIQNLKRCIEIMTSEEQKFIGVAEVCDGKPIPITGTPDWTMRVSAFFLEPKCTLAPVLDERISGNEMRENLYGVLGRVESSAFDLNYLNVYIKSRYLLMFEVDTKRRHDELDVVEIIDGHCWPFSNSLMSGHSKYNMLTEGEKLVSHNKKSVLKVRGCDLTVHVDGKLIWDLKTEGVGCYLVLPPDGELSLLRSTGDPVWEGGLRDYKSYIYPKRTALVMHDLVLAFYLTTLKLYPIWEMKE